MKESYSPCELKIYLSSEGDIDYIHLLQAINNKKYSFGQRFECMNKILTYRREPLIIVETYCYALKLCKEELESVGNDSVARRIIAEKINRYSNELECAINKKHWSTDQQKYVIQCKELAKSILEPIQQPVVSSTPRSNVASSSKPIDVEAIKAATKKRIAFDYYNKSCESNTDPAEAVRLLSMAIAIGLDGVNLAYAHLYRIIFRLKIMWCCEMNDPKLYLLQSQIQEDIAICKSLGRQNEKLEYGVSMDSISKHLNKCVCKKTSDSGINSSINQFDKEALVAAEKQKLAWERYKQSLRDDIAPRESLKLVSAAIAIGLEQPYVGEAYIHRITCRVKLAEDCPDDIVKFTLLQKQVLEDVETFKSLVDQGIYMRYKNWLDDVIRYFIGVIDYNTAQKTKSEEVIKADVRRKLANKYLTEAKNEQLTLDERIKLLNKAFVVCDEDTMKFEVLHIRVLTREKILKQLSSTNASKKMFLIKKMMDDIDQALRLSKAIQVSQPVVIQLKNIQRRCQNTPKKPAAPTKHGAAFFKNNSNKNVPKKTLVTASDSHKNQADQNQHAQVHIKAAFGKLDGLTDDSDEGFIKQVIDDLTKTIKLSNDKRLHCAAHLACAHLYYLVAMKHAKKSLVLYYLKCAQASLLQAQKSATVGAQKHEVEQQLDNVNSRIQLIEERSVSKVVVPPATVPTKKTRAVKFKCSKVNNNRRPKVSAKKWVKQGQSVPPKTVAKKGPANKRPYNTVPNKKMTSPIAEQASAGGVSGLAGRFNGKS